MFGRMLGTWQSYLKLKLVKMRHYFSSECLPNRDNEKYKRLDKLLQIMKETFHERAIDYMDRPDDLAWVSCCYHPHHRLYPSHVVILYEHTLLTIYHERRCVTSLQTVLMF